jgi:hypothetical protein
MVPVRPRANRSALLAIVITWAFGLATAHVLCSRDATARRLQDKTHAHAEPCQHIDQAVRAEEIDTAAQQVADARLSDVQHRRSLDLGQRSRRECFLELEEQVGADQQVFRFFGGESEIPEHIASRWCDLQLTFSSHHQLAS